MPNTLNTFTEATTLSVGDLVHVKRGTGPDSDKRMTEANLRIALITAAIVASVGATMNSDTDLSGKDWFLDEDDMLSNDDTKAPSQQSVVAYVASYVASAIAGGISYKGSYAADTNTPDLDTAPAGVLKGDMYTVTADGVFFTTDVTVGDVLIAEIDSASTEADWTIVQGNINFTPAQLLAMLLTVDGAGSGLDADTLDGAQLSAIVTKALFDANTILVANSDDTPVALTVAEQTILGRITAGSITGLTAAQVRTLLNVSDGATDKPIEHITMALGNEGTDATTGLKLTRRMPYAFTLTELPRLDSVIAPTGSAAILDIKENGATIFSTKITIDDGGDTSVTAATPAVLSDTALADNAKMTFHLDQVGSTVPGAGYKVTLIGRRT